MKYEAHFIKLVLGTVGLGLLLVFVAISQAEQAAPKSPETHSVTVPRVKQFDLKDDLHLNIVKTNYGRCDYACGMKPLPPIGCTPAAICACQNIHTCQDCGWVFTNCR
jgi:hypothetical protein